MRHILRLLREHGVGAIVALPVAAAGWYLWEKERAALRVTLRADIPIVTPAPDLPADFRLTYGQDTIRALRAIEVVIANTGNVPLLRADVEEPISVSFPGRILAAPVVTTKTPASLAPQLRLDSARTTVALAPLLLNDGDAFAFRVLLQNWTEARVPIGVRGRVRGVRELQVRDESDEPHADQPVNYLDLFLGFLSFFWKALAAVLGFAILYSAATAIYYAKKVAGAAASARDAAAGLETSPTVAARAAQLVKTASTGRRSRAGRLDALLTQLGVALRLLAVQTGRVPPQNPDELVRIAGDLQERELISPSLSGALRLLASAATAVKEAWASRVTADEYAATERLAALLVASVEEELASKLSAGAPGPPAATDQARASQR